MFSGQLTSCRDTTSDISRLMIHMRGRLTTIITTTFVTNTTIVIIIIIAIIVITTTIIITIVLINIMIRTTRED